MIQCQQCKKELNSIQWTHLKYSCIGNAKTIKEYKNLYPNSPLKSKESILKSTITLLNMIEKYGKEEGEKRWNSYCDRQAYSNTLEYKKEKYGWDKEKFNEYNKSRSQTLLNMIEKYGEEEGAKKWKSYCDRQSYTNSLEYFIEKYGEGDGVKKYLNCNKMKSRPIEFYLKKCNNDKALAEKLFLEDKENTYNSTKKHFSKISQEFFDLIDTWILEKFNIKNNTYYATKNKEFSKYDKLNTKFYFYDYCVPELNLILEFNGDLYHANPKKFKSYEIPPFRGNKLTSETIWKIDYQKNEFIKNLGFSLIIIWESDYLNNKSDYIEKLKNEIYENCRNL